MPGATHPFLSLSPEEAAPLLPAAAFTGPILWWANSLTCGGVERQILANAAFCSRAGLVLHLACADLSPKFGKDYFLDQARQHFRRVHDLSALPGLGLPGQAQAKLGLLEGLDPVFLEQTRRHLIFFMRFRPRLLQIWNADFPHVALAAALAGVPRVIVSGRSVSPARRAPLGLESPDEALTRAVLKFVLGFPRTVLANNSRAGAADYADWLGLAPEQVRLTPNVCPIPPAGLPDSPAGRNLRQNLGFPEDAPVLGGLTRFTRIKDPHLWVETARSLLDKRPGDCAAMFGDGHLRPDLLAGLKDSGLRDRLVLPGILKDTPAFFSLIRVLLMTSIEEGLPNAALEAQAHGLPVVSTLAGGVEDIVVHGRTGFVLPERDPGILAEHAAMLLDRPDLARDMGEKGRARIRELFSPERSGAMLLNIYRELALKDLPNSGAPV